MTFFTHTGELYTFFNTSKKYIYKKGEVILRAEDVPSGVYYIESGFVKAYSLNIDGTENIHVLLKPGEIFPRNWTFDKNPENVSFEAITTVTTRRQPKHDFLELLKTNINALHEVFEMTIDFMDILVNRINNLEFTSSYARVINRLLMLAERFGEKDGNRVTILAPITHSIIANTINISRETASRELDKLKKKGSITEVNHIIVIKDLQKLTDELTTFFEHK